MTFTHIGSQHTHIHTDIYLLLIFKMQSYIYILRHTAFLILSIMENHPPPILTYPVDTTISHYFQWLYMFEWYEYATDFSAISLLMSIYFYSTIFINCTDISILVRVSLFVDALTFMSRFPKN